MMEEKRSPLNGLSSVIWEYLSLKTGDFKNNIISGLAIGFSRVLSVLVIVMLLLIVLAFFALSFILLLGDAIGSWSGAAFIVSGVCLIGLIVLFFMRKRLFLNMFTNLFTEIADSASPMTDWKAMLLVIVRNLRQSL